MLISDEVISFRVSYQGGAARFGGDPDLTVFGKIIGGGLPIGAVGGKAEIMALLDPTVGPPVLASGGTFSGNPLSAIAGYAALTQLTPEEFARLEVLGDDLRARANAIFRRCRRARSGQRGRFAHSRRADGCAHRELPQHPQRAGSRSAHAAACTGASWTPVSSFPRKVWERFPRQWDRKRSTGSLMAWHTRHSRWPVIRRRLKGK